MQVHHLLLKLTSTSSNNNSLQQLIVLPNCNYLRRNFLSRECLLHADSFALNISKNASAVLWPRLKRCNIGHCSYYFGYSRGFYPFHKIDSTTHMLYSKSAISWMSFLVSGRVVLRISMKQMVKSQSISFPPVTVCLLEILLSLLLTSTLPSKLSSFLLSPLSSQYHWAFMAPSPQRGRAGPYKSIPGAQMDISGFPEVSK